MGMKLLPYDFSDPVFFPQCIKQPDNYQAAYFHIWNNFSCDFMLMYFLELGYRQEKKRKGKEREKIVSGQHSVLKTK